VSSIVMARGSFVDPYPSGSISLYRTGTSSKCVTKAVCVRNQDLQPLKETHLHRRLQ
jgi:hypothetical protein